MLKESSGAAFCMGINSPVYSVIIELLTFHWRAINFYFSYWFRFKQRSLGISLLFTLFLIIVHSVFLEK